MSVNINDEMRRYQTHRRHQRNAMKVLFYSIMVGSVVAFCLGVVALILNSPR